MIFKYTQCCYYRNHSNFIWTYRAILYTQFALAIFRRSMFSIHKRTLYCWNASILTRWEWLLIFCSNFKVRKKFTSNDIGYSQILVVLTLYSKPPVMTKYVQSFAFEQCIVPKFLSMFGSTYLCLFVLKFSILTPWYSVSNKLIIRISLSEQINFV